jgi:hypothetical protein
MAPAMTAHATASLQDVSRWAGLTGASESLTLVQTAVAAFLPAQAAPAAATQATTFQVVSFFTRLRSLLVLSDYGYPRRPVEKPGRDSRVETANADAIRRLAKNASHPSEVHFAGIEG